MRNLISYKKFINRISIITTTVIGLLFVIYGYFIQLHSIKQNLESETSLMVELIFENLYTSMQNGGTKEELNQIISNIENKISHSSVYLYKNAHETEEQNIKQIFTTKEAGFYKRGSHIDFARPIIFEDKCLKCHVEGKSGEIAAVIRLDFSILDLSVSLKDILIMISMLFLISIFVILSVWYIYLRRSFIAPIRGLIGQMLKISEYRDLKKGIKIDSNIKEIKKLELVFNEQSKKLADAYYKLEHDSNIDTLTKVYNRKKFNEYIKEELELVKRYGYDLTLIAIDLNEFKPINDTYGHEAGDNVLVEFSNIISGNIRTTDRFFRIGGDEFILVLSHTKSTDALTLICSLKDKIQSHILEYKGIEIKMSASFGYAQYKDDALELKELIKTADDRMYKEKESAKNRSFQ